MSGAVERLASLMIEIGSKATMSEGLTQAQEWIAEECDRVREMLVEKNRRYGNSALSPMRVMSQADTLEQIRVRIDDKISRLRGLQPNDTEDTELDLIGYLILLRVARRMAA
jgi:hypothetical protein